MWWTKAAVSTATSAWVSDAYYKHYTHPRNVKKPLLLLRSTPETNQISHFRDVVDLLRLVTDRIVSYAEVSLVLVLLRKYP